MSISMGDNITRNTGALTPWNITNKVRGWKDSVRDIGGFWDASGTYWTGKDDPMVSQKDAESLFLTGIGNHIVRSQHGRTCWEGRIAALELTLDGETSRRDLDITNSIKLKYASYSGNVLTNGSGESGLLAPNTATKWPGQVGDVPYILVAPGTDDGGTYRDWTSHGTRSFFVHAQASGWGNELTFDAGAATASANTHWQIRAAVNVIDNGVFADGVELYVKIGGVQVWASGGLLLGEHTIQAEFDTGVNSGAIYVGAASGEGTRWYIDGVSLQEAGSVIETAWSGDSDSISEYGTNEAEIILGSMHANEAAARQAQILAWLAWPRRKTKPASLDKFGQPIANGLRIECQGYVWTLAGKSASVGGIQYASTHITNLLALADFVTAGYIATNTLYCYVEEAERNRLWDCIEQVIKSGGTGGVRYCGGVYADRKFIYEPRATTPRYKRKGGRWLNMDGTLADPETMGPGIVFYEDVLGSVPTSFTVNDPHYAYVPGWEYDADSNSVTPAEDDNNAY